MAIIFLSTLGKRSQAVISREEERASVGLRATNDPSEGSFATLTDVLCNGGRISLLAAAGIGQMRYNGDMRRNHELAVTGKKRMQDKDTETQLGLFHVLPEECTTSLISMAKHVSRRTRRDFRDKLDERKKYVEDKMKQLQIDRCEKATEELIDAIFLFKQFCSPACWNTVEEARDNFERLTTKKEKLRHVKDQILMRYLGLGRVEAHHPWYLKGRAFTAEELFDHLINVVIPLATDGRHIPCEPPVNLPKVPDSIIVGTKSAARAALDSKSNSMECDIRLKAERKIELQEEMGLVDQEEYMQQTSWPIEQIKEGFKLQICWEYYDAEDGLGNAELRWCGGVIEQVVRDRSERNNYFDVTVRWNEDIIEPGMTNPTQERLKKKDFNPQQHRQGAWRADLSVLRNSVQI